MSDDFVLARHPSYGGVPGQLVLLILDGVGLFLGRSEGYEGNAFDLAATPNLDRLFATAPVFLELKAHGTAVGLPSDSDMGNSEVGHNAMGAGRVFEQGARLVNQAIADGSLFEAAAWRELVARVRGRSSTLHFIGLLSDGNVHSNLSHLRAMLEQAHADTPQRRNVRLAIRVARHSAMGWDNPALPDDLADIVDGARLDVGMLPVAEPADRLHPPILGVFRRDRLHLRRDDVDRATASAGKRRDRAPRPALPPGGRCLRHHPAPGVLCPLREGSSPDDR